MPPTKKPDPSPVTPEAAPTLEGTAARLAAKKLEVEEASRVVTRAFSRIGLVQSNPDATEAQRETAFETFGTAQSDKVRKELELNALEELHAKLQAEKDAEDNAAENARIAALVKAVSDELYYHHTPTYDDVRELYEHLHAIPRLLLKMRAHDAEAAVKVRSIEKYLPRDAKGYPSISPPDGSFAGGVFAERLYQDGGTISGIHPLIIASHFDIPAPSKDDRYGFLQLKGIVDLYCESLRAGHECLRRNGVEHPHRPTLERGAQVLQRYPTKRQSLEELEELDRADYAKMQAEGIAAAEVRRAEQAKKMLHEQIRRRGNPIVKPAQNGDTVSEIIEAAPDVPVDPAIAYEHDTTRGNPDRSPSPRASAKPASTQRVAAKMTPAQNAELGAVGYNMNDPAIGPTDMPQPEPPDFEVYKV